MYYLNTAILVNYIHPWLLSLLCGASTKNNVNTNYFVPLFEIILELFLLGQSIDVHVPQGKNTDRCIIHLNR